MMKRIATVMSLGLALMTMGSFSTVNACYDQGVAADDDNDDDSDTGDEHSAMTTGALPALAAHCR
jgi:hypothetical protein